MFREVKPDLEFLQKIKKQLWTSVIKAMIKFLNYRIQWKQLNEVRNAAVATKKYNTKFRKKGSSRLNIF